MPKQKQRLPRWEEPPTNQRVSPVKRATRIDREVEKMKENPGQWMKVRENASSGAYVVYKKRGCDVRVKTVGEQRYDVWARWADETE